MGLTIFKTLIVIFFSQLFIACIFQAENTNQNPSSMNAPILPNVSGFDTTIDGKQVGLYYIQNKNGLKAAITNYGARMVGMLVPDKHSQLRDVVIGFDKLVHFIAAEEPFFGAVVGRYGNRIAKGRFSLDGNTYQLDINNGVNSLHGGRTGFHNRVWDVVYADSTSIQLRYLSLDGEEGYPGNLTTTVTYTLTVDNELKMDYLLSTDKATVVNITNHNFWNLNGEGSGSINNHQLKILAERFIEVDSTLIPVNISKVENTPFDFRNYNAIGARLTINNTQLKYGGGYDHNYVLDKGLTNQPELVASARGDQSGIQMDVFTTEPGMQFYGGNVMKGKHILKSGSKDDHQTAFCLETQHYPDSPNQPDFPSTVLEPKNIYKSSTIYKFGYH